MIERAVLMPLIHHRWYRRRLVNNITQLICTDRHLDNLRTYSLIMSTAIRYLTTMRHIPNNHRYAIMQAVW